MTSCYLSQKKGLAQEPGDFTAEISPADDPTLSTTHREQSSAVRSMVVHWGSPFAVDAVTAADPLHRSRYQLEPPLALPSIIAYNGKKWTCRRIVFVIFLIFFGSVLFFVFVIFFFLVNCGICALYVPSRRKSTLHALLCSPQCICTLTCVTAAGMPLLHAIEGLVDTTIPIEHIRAVQRAYEEVNATLVVRALPNQPHACWDANVTVDGVVTTQSADAFDFIRREQQLQPIGA